MKLMKSLSHDNPSSGRDSDPKPPGALSIQQRYSVLAIHSPVFLKDKFFKFMDGSAMTEPKNLVEYDTSKIARMGKTRNSYRILTRKLFGKRKRTEDNKRWILIKQVFRTEG
jgi:hypothetical protein